MTYNRTADFTVTFQSTPPARGATPLRPLRTRCPRISIHAPREGGDQTMGKPRVLTNYFNPRPPRGGRPALY